eukprot:764511-Hanusia_phi.AAC.4
MTTPPFKEHHPTLARGVSGKISGRVVKKDLLSMWGYPRGSEYPTLSTNTPFLIMIYTGDNGYLVCPTPLLLLYILVKKTGTPRNSDGDQEGVGVHKSGVGVIQGSMVVAGGQKWDM